MKGLGAIFKNAAEFSKKNDSSPSAGRQLSVG